MITACFKLHSCQKLCRVYKIDSLECSRKGKKKNNFPWCPCSTNTIKRWSILAWKERNSCHKQVPYYSWKINKILNCLFKFFFFASNTLFCSFVDGCQTLNITWEADKTQVYSELYDYVITKKIWYNIFTAQKKYIWA